MKIKNNTRWQKIRHFFQDVHLWLGLASGLFVIVICFSGTVYVYNTELTEMWAPHQYRIEQVPQEAKIPVDSLIPKLEKYANGSISSLYIPASENSTYQFNVKGANDKSRSGTTYFVNPYNGAITGNSLEKNRMKEFMRTMFSLHRWLLLDKIETPVFSGISNRELGSKITGWATIIFTLGCITGLVIWFPRKIRNWRQGLKIKTSASWKRINHDLHNSLAFYALIFLLLMGLTGPQWSFDWYRTGMRKALGTYEPKVEAERSPAQNVKKDEALVKMNTKGDESQITIAQILILASAQLPYPGNYRISYPEEQGAPFSIHKTKTGFFAPAAGDRLTIDSEKGTLLSKDIFTEKPVNERIAGSIKAIHVGNVYGSFTKALYFLACLIATSLPITGTLIWVNKLRKKNKKRKKGNARTLSNTANQQEVTTST